MHDLPEGQAYCSHCGTRRRHLEQDPTTPCTRREPHAPRPFRSAMDDLDAIHEGIQRLRREQKEAVTSAGQARPCAGTYLRGTHVAHDRFPASLSVPCVL